MPFKFNPLTAEFDLVTDNVTFSEQVGVTRLCSPTAVAGDLVMESETTADTVDVAVDNTDIRPVFGIITEKFTTTTCRVMMIGTITGLAGSYTKGRKVFLGTDGNFTSTYPATNYAQTLGVAKETDQIDFKPEFTRVRRI